MTALRSVSILLQGKIQDLILKDMVSARDEATPPEFKELVERYYEVLSKTGTGKQSRPRELPGRIDRRPARMNVKSTIQWATPYSLGLLLALAVAAVAGFVLLRWASGRPIAPARRLGLLVLRLAILAILGLIIINPVRVDETPGTVERPKLFYLLDTSQSMAIGKGSTRWDQVVQTIRDADRARDPRDGAEVSMFRFGSRLAAVDADFWRPGGSRARSPEHARRVLAAEPPRPGEPPPAPTDSDTLLGASLEGLTDRFGQTPPQAVVVFSDGRARDPDRADTIARAYGRMKVPVHVLPVGDEDVGGDVAIVSMVAPNQVRKFSRVAAQVYRAELRLQGQTLRAEDRGRRVRRQAGGGARPHAGRPRGWPDQLLACLRVGRPGPPDRGPDRPATGRGVGGEQRLRCRPGDRPHQDPRALPRRGDRPLRRQRARRVAGAARSAGPTRPSRKRSWKTRMSSARP